MILSAKQLAMVLQQISQESSLSTEEIVSRCIVFLKRKKKLSLLPQVLVELEKLEKALSSDLEVTITTATPVAEDMKPQCEKKASEIFGSSHVRCVYRVDASILGGIVFSTDEMLWDASVEKTLRDLRHSLS